MNRLPSAVPHSLTASLPAFLIPHPSSLITGLLESARAPRVRSYRSPRASLRRLSWGLFLGLPWLWGAAPVSSQTPEVLGGWPALLRQHLASHPEARAQDLYKLVYQGTMGAEHAVPDPQAAERGLVRELDSVEPDAAEPLTEPCDPNGVLLRVNLRPFKARGGSAAALARAFVQTAEDFEPNPAVLAQLLEKLGSADLGNPAAEAELRAFRPMVLQLDYPALSHSDAYREAYHPAYRVVLARLVPGLGLAADPPAP